MPMVGSEMDPLKYTRNVLKVEIFYEKLNYKSMSETRAYPVRAS